MHYFQFLILVVDDLEKKHPAQLADALGIAIDAGVLAHDVLDGLDEGADGHGLGSLSIQGRLEVRGRPQRSRPARRRPRSTPPACRGG